MKSQRELARLLATRDRTPSGLSAPQVQYSSIEDGSLKEYSDGQLVSEIGEQWDGSHGVFPLSGPIPPRPSAPTVEGGTSATISWDGYFLDAKGKPDITITPTMDWSRVEVHISRTKGFAAITADTLVDTIETPRGGSRPALPGPGTWYAVLVSRSMPGKSSEQSPETVFEIAPGITEEEIQAIRDDFQGVADGLAEDLRQNTVAQGGLNDRLTDLTQITLPALEEDLTAAGERLDAADTLLNVTFPKRLTDAERAASDAKLAVEDLATRGDQLIKNGDFELGDVNWQKGASWSIIAAAARGGSKFGMRVVPRTANAWPSAERMPTTQGRVYRMEMWLRRIGTDTWSTQGIGFVAQTQDAAGVYSTPVIRAKLSGSDAELRAGDIPTDSFVKVQADVTIAQPNAKTVVFAPWFYVSADNSYDVDDVRVVDITLASEALTVAGQAKIKAEAAERAAGQAAADLVTAKARADTAAAAATTAAAEAAAAEASSARATGAAGVAEAAADKSRQDAAAALTQAQNAGGNVATARAAADAAQVAADASKAAASSAGTAAANADAKAAQAAADAAKAAADAVTAASKATTAASEASAAKTSASTAASKATAAETAASTAAGKATASATEAAAAATRAAAAESSATKATGAAGVAETAADTARQNAAAALTQAQNSGSNATAAQTAANAAKAASDTAAAQAKTAGTAAAAADAAAASAAAKAAQAAADLIVARNAAADARGDADTALDRADSAITAANGAARVLYSTANPSGTAREGDTWRKTSSDVGPVMAEWRYTRNAAGTLAWRAQQVTGEMISNLDVGRLTVGSGAFTQAVFEKMAAQTAAIQKADIGNLTVTETSNLNNVVAERMSVKIGEFVEVYASKIVADAGNFKTGVAEKFAAGIGSFLKLNATQVYIGEAGNIFPSDFNDDGWQAINGITTGATGGKTGGSSMLIPATTSQIGSYYAIDLDKRDRAPRLMPGMTYLIKANVKGSTTIPVGAARIYVRLYNTASKSTTGYTWMTPSNVGNAKAIAANVWGEVEGQVTIPDDSLNTAAVVGIYSQATATGSLRYSELTIQPVITPALVVDGLVSGQNIIGAMIQTQATANRGVKITDAGLFAYSSTGAETLRFDGANSIITGATLRTAASGTRIQISTAGGLEGWSGSTRYLKADADGLEMIGSIASAGMTFEPTPRPIQVKLATVARAAYSGTAVFNSPALVFDDGGVGGIARAAGVYSLDGSQIHVNARRNTTSGDPMGMFSLSQDVASLDAVSVQLGAWTPYAAINRQTLTADIRAQTVTLLGRDINLDGAVKVNGTKYGDSEIRERITVASGWTHHTTGGWNGLWIEQMGKLTIISGAVARSSAWGNGAVVATLPARYRPASMVAGSGCEVNAAGSLTIPAGSVATSFSITYYAA